ncbi:flavin-containing monooxygenase [Stenotrophobium rhamnosiphilum]|uniref:FAD-containing monooxygenase EthA n=1 Tax=Stenotrophobium rhamnosiphilum TaxID=2029166 RepID=A0A2T5MG84_9GAMM|nr:NAD(P)/FAD-dependent oxidoreductase [Stenotrophobium rhamnosiphilum]PTU31587.1 FAD-containing monooxygenase EthA [Stenotrophobium rhamnosiphilum]
MKKQSASASAKAVDVLIIGAGLSGIGAACHLRRECPNKTFAIIERREAIGGTWDLFRYPGIRSDSDMYTFGYNFKPWTEPRVLADGPSIKKYVTETAREYDVEQHIQFGRKVLSANWSSAKKHWSVEVLDEASGKTETYTASFLLGATGYYNYDAGYRPKFEGESKFKGQFIHPQHWPENLDYTGKRVVIIGSGATAITLVPSMADKAEHVTMLQRSPTYILSVPGIDPVAARLQKYLPAKIAYRLNRTRNIGLQRFLYEASRRHPKLVRRMILGLIKKQVGDKVDMRHFTPSYNPWDQRLCVVPSGDLFKALRKGKASIETDVIDTFTADGIKLRSGETIKADIVVTATGLEVQMLGGVAVHVDGELVAPKDHLTYKGVMLQDVPNAAIVIGYTNASWTLRADLASEYVCRVINYMDKKGYKSVIPRDDEDSASEDTVMGALASGYIQRAADRLPRQGKRAPWRVVQNYLQEIPTMRRSPINDGVLEFDGKTSSKAKNATARLIKPFRMALGR